MGCTARQTCQIVDSASGLVVMVKGEKHDWIRKFDGSGRESGWRGEDLHTLNLFTEITP